MVRPREAPRLVATRWTAVVVAVLGVVLSLTAALGQQSRQRADARAAFVSESRQITDAVEDQLSRYAVAGQAIAAFLEQPGEVTAEEYAAFVETLRREGALASAQGFNVSRLTDPSGATARIEYVHPFERNRAALGFDLLSNPLAARPARQAARIGRPQLSEALTLAVERQGQAGVAVLTPVRDGGGDVTGWSHVVLRGQDFLDQLPFVSDDVALRLSDVTPDGERLIGWFPDAGTAREALATSPLRATVRHTILGQEWTFDYAGLPELVGRRTSVAPALILAGGLLATGFAVVLIQILRRSEHRARGLAAMRTLELREANERLAQNIAELEQAAKIKDDFLSVVSHEFRTPLTVIRGTSSTTLTFRRDELDDETLEALERIDRNADRLDGLVDDLLTSARLRSGTVEAEARDVPLREAAMLVAGDLGLSLADGSLRVEVPPAAAVRVDPEHLTRILTNLLSNAVKYGAPPVIVETTGTERDTVELTVRDHGPGVPDAVRQRLFERFSSSNRPGPGARGVGLGLSIVRQLAELNGGAVRYDGSSSGARFVVTLPAAPRSSSGPRDGLTLDGGVRPER